MGKIRPAKNPKKLTRETLKANPLIAMLTRQRAKEIRELRKAKKASELDLD